MKKYKAIVIDGKKLLRLLILTCMLSLFLILSLFLGFSGRLTANKGLFSPQAILWENFPILGAANQAEETLTAAVRERISALGSSLLGFDCTKMQSIIPHEFPLVAQVDATELSRLAQAEDTDRTQVPLPSLQNSTAEIPEENRAPIRAVDLSPDKSHSGAVILGNQTSYSVDIAESLATPPSIDISGSGPKVLVIHTHATEAYAPNGAAFYDITASDRNQNIRENVVSVGTTLCHTLEEKGIEVLHDTELHDYPSFNGSYAHALSAIESYLAEYPGIQVILDIHRDSIIYDDNTKAKPLTQINGKNAAQLMFVVGTDEKGLYHPNWRENIKSAIHFQNAINQRYPTLMRHINLRQERFNGHTGKASMIIEVGSSGNSLAEATYAIQLAGECIADFLLQM